MIKKKYLNIALYLVSPILFADPAPTDISKQQTEVINFVKSAVEYYKNKGETAAFKEFNKPEGLFTHGVSYIFVSNYAGVVLANGNPHARSLIGVNTLARKDDDGTPIVKNEIKIARMGGGWNKYKWQNHVSNRYECKRTYILPLGEDKYIGSGYYYPIPQNGKC